MDGLADYLFCCIVIDVKDLFSDAHLLYSFICKPVSLTFHPMFYNFKLSFDPIEIGVSNGVNQVEIINNKYIFRNITCYKIMLFFS